MLTQLINLFDTHFLPPGLPFDLVELADVVKGLIGQTLGVFLFAPMFFANGMDFDKLSSGVGPTTQMHDTDLLIEVIIAGKVITLDVAAVAV